MNIANTKLMFNKCYQAKALRQMFRVLCSNFGETFTYIFE